MRKTGKAPSLAHLAVCQCLIEVGDEVVWVLKPDGQAQQVLGECG
jgi:hypothetical protein